MKLKPWVQATLVAIGLIAFGYAFTYGMALVVG